MQDQILHALIRYLPSSVKWSSVYGFVVFLWGFKSEEGLGWWFSPGFKGKYQLRGTNPSRKYHNIKHFDQFIKHSLLHFVFLKESITFVECIPIVHFLWESETMKEERNLETKHGVENIPVVKRALLLEYICREYFLYVIFSMKNTVFWMVG